MDPGSGVRWRLYLEAVRAWIPIVVSVCAISFTIYQGMLSRRHTKLSVQPRVDWRIEEDAGGGTLTLSLVNVGFGPAIVRDIAVLVDGEPIATDSLEACHEIAARIGRADPGRWDLSCFAEPNEHVLRPGDAVVIFGSRPNQAHAAEDQTEAVVDYRRLGARARYCSFYEDCWQLPPT
jgi:hypothetical protein